MPEAEVAADPAARLLAESSEEGQKVSRNGGATYRAVFRRRAAPLMPGGEGGGGGGGGAGAAAGAAVPAANPTVATPAAEP